MPGRRNKINPARESAAVPWDQPRLCPVSGKRMYADEGEAISTAAHRLADKQKGPALLRAYNCPHCRTWHLTSSKKR
jgi:hypothetical protein